MNGEDFISRYVKLLCALTDAPVEFLEASAFSLLSIAAGRRWVFPTASDASLFESENGSKGKYLNVWFIILGKSRVGRKTVVLSKLKEFCQKIGINVIPNIFTHEYLISELSKSNRDGEVHAIWVQDECSAFFDLLKRMDSYMTSTDAILSILYDCKTYSKGTQQRGREEVRNPYLVVVAASTEDLPACFNDRMIKQGFLNRFCYICGERQYRPLRTTPLTPEEEKERDDLLIFLEALVKKKYDTSLNMDEETKKKFQQFEENIEKKIEKEDLGLKEGYLGNLPSLAIKFACLYRISRISIEEIQSAGEVKIEKQDLEKAIQYCKKLWENFGKVLELRMKHSVERKSAVTESAEIERIYLMIKERGTISRSELLINSDISADRLDKIIKTLTQREEIEEIHETTKGRRRTLYRCLK